MKNQTEFKSFTDAIAREAGGLLRKYLNKSHRVSYKGRMNLVTDVDKRCEDLIIKKIRRSYPLHSILSEESGASGCSKSQYRWLIDPLDGTTNYVHRVPFFCVSIALAMNDELIAAAVYDPIRNELFSASRGNGSFLNNKRIRVSGIATINKALLSTGFPYKFGNSMKINIENFVMFMKRAQAVRRPGSAALDLCYVASSRFDGFWEMELKPWDTAAGVLIIKEAGGEVTDFKNRPFTPSMKQIVASNKRLHNQMLKVLS